MVGGRLKCLGSIQHLKNKFGKGIMIETKFMDPSNEQLAALVNRIGTEVIALAELPSVCRSLGFEDRYNMLMTDRSQAHAALIRDNQIGTVVFATWWIIQDGYYFLYQELAKVFTGVRALERQDLKVRWQIEKGDIKLNQMFKTWKPFNKSYDFPSIRLVKLVWNKCSMRLQPRRTPMDEQRES